MIHLLCLPVYPCGEILDNLFAQVHVPENRFYVKWRTTNICAISFSRGVHAIFAHFVITTLSNSNIRKNPHEFAIWKVFNIYSELTIIINYYNYNRKSFNNYPKWRWQNCFRRERITQNFSTYFANIVSDLKNSKYLRRCALY